MIVIDLCFNYFAQCAIIKNHGKEMYWCAVKVVQRLCINNVQNHTINYQMLLWRVMNPGSVIPLVKKMHEGNVSLLNCQESVYLLCVLPRTIAAAATAVTHRLLPLHPCCIAASPLHHPHLHRYGFFFFFFYHNHHIFFIHSHNHACTQTHKHTTHTRIIPFFYFLFFFLLSTPCFVYSLH